MRPVFFAYEEAQEGAALVGGVVADGAAEHGVTGFERVECGAEGDGGGDVECGFVAGEAGEAAKVQGEFDADQGHGEEVLRLAKSLP